MEGEAEDFMKEKKVDLQFLCLLHVLIQFQLGCDDSIHLIRFRIWLIRVKDLLW